MRQVEILAPAGSIEGLYGALDMGADAVYVGTRRFGARAFADNPSVEELQEALVYAHLRDKRIYLTVNTLLTDRELEEELYPMIAPLYESGLDACIVQDIGVLDFLHENFPEMDLHASTQMTIFSGDEANLWKPFGITRYVPARELTIEEIREAREQTDLEIEVFVHGALCYCYSGQCMMSETIGGRSGNRGMCAQPCRLVFDSPYGKGHFLNTKDSCTLLDIPELVEAGIDSFKIEGRMKKKEYSAGLAYLYRKYVDVYQQEGKAWFEELRNNRDSELWRDYKKCMELYNRGGFSRSFLFEKDKTNLVYPKKNNHYGLLVGTVTRAGKGMAEFFTCEELHYQDVLEFRDEKGNPCYEYTVKNGVGKNEKVVTNVLKGSRIYRGQKVFRIRNEKLLTEIQGKMIESQKKILLTGEFVGRQGELARLIIRGKETEIMVQGELVQPASNRPVEKDDVRKRLMSLGNTSYEWESLSVDVEPGSFLSLGSLKKLRREGIALWESKASGGKELPVTQMENEPAGFISEEEKSRIPDIMISVSSCLQLESVLAFTENRDDVMIHLKLENFSPEEWKMAVKLAVGRKLSLSVPRILHGESRRRFERDWEEYGDIFRVGENGENTIDAVVVDSHYGILHANRYFPGMIKIAGEHFYQKNERAKKVYRECGIEPSFVRNYGRIPVMASKSCVARTLGKCGRRGKQSDVEKNPIPITTPKGDEFVVENHCRYCYNTIYTKEPVRERGVDRIWLDFTWEGKNEIREVLRAWDLF